MCFGIFTEQVWLMFCSYFIFKCNLKQYITNILLQFSIKCNICNINFISFCRPFLLNDVCIVAFGSTRCHLHTIELIENKKCLYFLQLLASYIARSFDSIAFWSLSCNLHVRTMFEIHIYFILLWNILLLWCFRNSSILYRNIATKSAVFAFCWNCLRSYIWSPNIVLLFKLTTFLWDRVDTSRTVVTRINIG